MAASVSSSSHHERWGDKAEIEGSQILGIDSTLLVMSLLEESPQLVEDAADDERLQCIIQSLEAEIIKDYPNMTIDHHNRTLDVLVKGNCEDAPVPPPPPPPPQDHFGLKDLNDDDYVSASHSLPTSTHGFQWSDDDMEIMNSSFVASSFLNTDHVLGCGGGGGGGVGGGGVMEYSYGVSLEDQPHCSLWQDAYDPMACN